MKIKSVYFPDKEFASNEELFKSLKTNKELIIANKKSEIYKSIEKDEVFSVVTNQEAIKKISEQTKAFEVDKDYYYFVVNSSNILDSHRDLHIEGNWEKSVKEQQGKVYLVFDHSLKRGDVIAMKSDIEMFTAKIPFKLIGKEYDGDTYCLIYKVAKDKIINTEAKDWLEKGYELEASVRMQYMDIDLAMNSQAQGDEKELENYNKYYPLIANKDDYEVINYFWVIKQAKNVLESSLVLFGSNSATGRVQENKSEPGNHSENDEPPNKGTQPEKTKQFINVNLY